MARRKKEKKQSSSQKIIKRYGNRKLYDTEQSRYVTLEEIFQMVKQGIDLKVIDNKSKEDLTMVTLTQIMLEEQKLNKNMLPLSVLKKLLQQSGESITEWFQKSRESFTGPITGIAPWTWPSEWVQKSKDSITQIKQEAEEQLTRIIEKGHETKEESTSLLREWFINQQKYLDSIQKKIDDRIKYFFFHVTGLEEMEKQIQDLENTLSNLESRLSKYEK